MNKIKNNKNLYISLINKFGNINVWKVDGSYVRTNINEEFTNFGQHYRYKFIPPNEFWLDQEANQDEIQFFIEHLLREYQYMKNGYSYKKSLMKADKEEQKLRRMSGDIKKIINNKAIPELEITHKELWKKLENGISVWIVNGRMVRSIFNIDFTEGGHDHVYEFIPLKEIWIDDDVIEKERGYVLLHELYERNQMSRGLSYNKAHMQASKIEFYCRHNPDELHNNLIKEGW